MCTRCAGWRVPRGRACDTMVTRWWTQRVDGDARPSPRLSCRHQPVRKHLHGVALTPHGSERRESRVTATTYGASLWVLPRSTDSDRRTGGGADGCTLVQISQFRRASSAASASARSRAGMGERNACGLRSSRGQPCTRCVNGVTEGRREKAFQRGVAATSYWLSGSKPRMSPIERTTELVV